jgi:hypothetical protein
LNKIQNIKKPTTTIFFKKKFGFDDEVELLKPQLEKRKKCYANEQQNAAKARMQIIKDLERKESRIK